MASRGEFARCYKCLGLFNGPELVLDKSIKPYEYKCRDVVECGYRVRLKNGEVSKKLPKTKSIPSPLLRELKKLHKSLSYKSYGHKGWVVMNVWITKDDKENFRSLIDVSVSSWVRNQINELLRKHGQPELTARRVYRKQIRRRRS